MAAADAQRVGWHQALNQNLLRFAPAGLFAGVHGAHQPGQTVHIFQPQVADPRGQVAAKAQHHAGGRWRFFGCAGSDFDFACRRGGHCHNRCVVAVEHHRSVVAENAGFGGGVIVHAAVPVQMVLAEVEHHGRSRLKQAAVVQLEARQLQHPHLGQGLGIQRLGQRIEQGWADVAGYGDRLAGARDQLAGQRGDRGFAVGAGDGQHAGCVGVLRVQVGQGLGKQAEFATHPQAQTAGCVHQGRGVCGCQTGAHKDGADVGALNGIGRKIAV